MEPAGNLRPGAEVKARAFALGFLVGTLALLAAGCTRAESHSQQQEQTQTGRLVTLEAVATVPQLGRIPVQIELREQAITATQGQRAGTTTAGLDEAAIGRAVRGAVAGLGEEIAGRIPGAAAIAGAVAAAVPAPPRAEDFAKLIPAQPQGMLGFGKEGDLMGLLGALWATERGVSAYHKRKSAKRGPA